MRPPRLPVILLAGLALGLGSTPTRPLDAAPPPPPPPPGAEAEEALARGLADTVEPMLRRHCHECHDPREKEGELDLSAFTDVAKVQAAPGVWRDVLERVQSGEMPPDDKPRPGQDEVEALTSWIQRALGSAPQGPSDPGRVTVRRLNRAEYDHTIRDMLQVDLRPAQEFPDDDVGYGFDRIGDVLTIPPLLMDKYLAAADQVARAAILDWRPERLRVEAEEGDRRGSEGRVDGGFVILYSNGSIGGRVTVRHEGEYVIRARAYGLQAGPGPARMALRIDGREVTHVDVPVDADDEPGVYEVRVRVAAGARELSAAFTNDYYRPDDPDPGQRDRNLAIDYVELEGPIEPPPLPWAHRTYVTVKPAADAKPAARKAAAKQVLEPLVTRAFRRQSKPDEVERYAKLVEVAFSEGESYERGLQLALQAILCSSHFLFRFELEASAGRDGEVEAPAAPEPARPATGGGARPQGGAARPAADATVRTRPISEWELATRLSYFLWSSLPDDELIALARAGTLRANLLAQVRRMLADPKATRLVDEFAMQWLHLRRLEISTPDPETFKTWDEELRRSMREETARFVDACLRENRPILDLVDGPFTFVDARLARHYGLSARPAKDEWVRVDVPPGRGGLLGHASVLTATSNPTRTSPVKRGRWVLDALLDDPPAPPPPGNDSLRDEGTPAAMGKTLRERLELHRAKAECAGCHARMDPIGFGLERFDAIGARRESEGGQPISTAATMPGGVQVDGLEGVRGWLRAKKRTIARGLARRLLVFAIGRGPIAADDAALDRLVDSLAPDYKLADLVVGLIGLDAFQRRRVTRTGR